MTFWQRLTFWLPAKRIEIVRKSSNALSLRDWCSEKVLVSTGGRLWADPDFQMAMDVLENEHPAWRVMNPDSQPHHRIAQQAMCEGYTMALANLKALKIFVQHKELGEPDFSPEITEQ